MKGEQVGLIVRGVTPEQIQDAIFIKARREKVEPTIIVAKCDCRYKVVSALSKIAPDMYARWELDTICVPHSQERTKILKLRSIAEKHSPVRTTDRGNHE